MITEVKQAELMLSYAAERYGVVVEEITSAQYWGDYLVINYSKKSMLPKLELRITVFDVLDWFYNKNKTV